jgi:nickel-dependent lactate racemase
MIGQGFHDKLLSEGDIDRLTESALTKTDLSGKRVLIIIPDSTRTAPIPLMFRLFHRHLSRNVAALDYLIALGTHRIMSEDAINNLVGITAAERAGKYSNIKILNHRWDIPESFVTLGRINENDIKSITNGLMRQSVDVRINKLVMEYDQLIVCGPTFPHEVVGFSGGNKYFFPGIGGAEVINFSHWLGAVITNYSVIGTKLTPVRQIIDRAASFIDRPKLCFSMVVKDNNLAGLYIGPPEEAYDAAADLSSKIHIQWINRPFKKVISVLPKMYDDLWTGAKGMYKLEPAIADGGEVIIYAPHMNEVSYSHGRLLYEIGYHVRDYFVKQWDRFKNYPGGVLAHSTHLKGMGEYDAASCVESPRIKVTLATGISNEQCQRLNLGYRDPSEIKLEEYRDRESEGVAVILKAGEMLYRVKPAAAAGD